ncbi:MAG: phage tail protein [Anaerolineae bacterium]|nr:phage tail protein [Anaerolineae bacterium]
MTVNDAPTLTSGFRFGLEIQGLVVGWFTECTSLSVERATLPYEQGGVNAYTVQLPGRVSYTKVTLRGGHASNALWEWFQSGQYNADAARRNVTVIVYDADGSEITRWDMLDCLPLKCSGPLCVAGASQGAMQEIQIGRGEGGGEVGAVQRASLEGPATSSEAEAADQLDLSALALQVYDLLRQDLRLDRERRTGRRQ